MTIITATTRLSRELRQEFDRKQEAAGLSSWPSAEILPFTAWLQDLWEIWLFSEGAAAPAADRLLRPAEERVIWKRLSCKKPKTSCWISPRPPRRPSNRGDYYVTGICRSTPRRGGFCGLCRLPRLGRGVPRALPRQGLVLERGTAVGCRGSHRRG